MSLPHPLRRETDKPQGRRFRRSIYVLPSLFTALNMAFGYYAMWQSFNGSALAPWHYDNAAKAIGFAILFDGLDGKIARLTNTTSDFGRELDSLADVITFGVAPAILAWVWGFREIGTLNGHLLVNRVVQFGALTTFIFLVAGASRLARFNIQANPKPWNPGRPGKKYFVGMAIPAGAGVIAAVVHFFGGDPITAWWMAIGWGVLVFFAAILMVSTWRYYSFKDIDFRTPHPFRLIVVLAAIVCCIVFASQISLFIIAIGYMLSGLIMGMGFLFRRRRGTSEHPDGAGVTEAS
ncbi:MAG TPA: phosphatidylcholine/phosphatidylserine synthase [Terriglobales bacterium]|nr:phosphatidylcholine/phosphatidylserine synthase [Terriglobales bacterium]